MVLCAVLPWLGFASQTQQQATKEDLNDIKQQIKSQQQQLKSNDQERQKVEEQLKQDDLLIAQLATKLRATQNQQQQTKQRLAELNTQQKQLVEQKHQQEQLLAEQLRSAYSAGHHDYIKLLLNQQKPEQVQRTLTYYQYLNDARISSISNFTELLEKINQVEQQQQQQAQQLQKLIEQQQQQRQLLVQKQTQRQTTLDELSAQITTSKQRLKKLEGEEKSLIRTLAKIQASLREQNEFNGLSKLKRKLKWPVKGRVAHAFGSRKQGYLRWKGVLMHAPVGRQVNAIHNGTVLFADWLKGYGLVIVIDHGDGYMSLYGHNQALLKNVGDNVLIGEPIALVGQSGGVNQSGLYFEIRHKGKPVNPKLWCR